MLSRQIAQSSTSCATAVVAATVAVPDVDDNDVDAAAADDDVVDDGVESIVTAVVVVDRWGGDKARHGGSASCTRSIMSARGVLPDSGEQNSAIRIPEQRESAELYSSICISIHLGSENALLRSQYQCLSKEQAIHKECWAKRNENSWFVRGKEETEGKG